jgi:hypothetical protein
VGAGGGGRTSSLARGDGGSCARRSYSTLSSTCKQQQFNDEIRMIDSRSFETQALNIALGVKDLIEQLIVLLSTQA